MVSSYMKLHEIQCRFHGFIKKSKDPGPLGPALVHPGFRLVEPKSLQLGERGDMGDYIYQQCSDVRFSAGGSGVSNRSRPLGRSRSWNGSSFTGVGLQLQPHRCSGFRIRFLLTSRMKLHHLLQKCSFFLIKLAAFLASGAARMKLHGMTNDD